MLPALKTLAEQQSSPTKNTEAEITHLLDYAATNPSAIIQYKASNVILHIDSDTSYPSETRARSRTGGHYYLSSLPTNPKTYPNLLPPANGPIHTECRILKHVVASAAEAEVRGLFHNGKTAVPLIITLHELGFTQPPTPIKTDNSAAEDIFTATVRQKKVQGNRHAILLDEGQGKTKRFFRLLETRKSKHGGFFHKTSPTTSP